MRKFLLLITFFTGAPFVIIISLLFLIMVSFDTHHTQATLGAHTTNTVAFAALPSNQNVFTDTIVQEEARVEIVRQFLAKYKSPLEPHAEYIVDMADKHGLDFRLLPAIAMQETNLCKKAKEGSYNCWGWGVYGGKYTFFESYPAAIETISRTLAHKYRNKYGLVTPDEIQQLYNPSNTSNWAYAVNHFMEKLQ
jgi:hypothetical protein